VSTLAAASSRSSRSSRAWVIRRVLQPGVGVGGGAHRRDTHTLMQQQAPAAVQDGCAVVPHRAAGCPGWMPFNCLCVHVSVDSACSNRGAGAAQPERTAAPPLPASAAPLGSAASCPATPGTPDGWSWQSARRTGALRQQETGKQQADRQADRQVRSVAAAGSWQQSAAVLGTRQQAAGSGHSGPTHAASGKLMSYDTRSKSTHLSMPARRRWILWSAPEPARSKHGRAQARLATAATNMRR
jgi:hypothetical protein